MDTRISHRVGNVERLCTVDNIANHNTANRYTKNGQCRTKKTAREVPDVECGAYVYWPDKYRYFLRLGTANRSQESLDLIIQIN